MKSETVTLNIETELYKKAKLIIEKYGYTFEEAIILFFKACIACGGFPFSIAKEDGVEYE